MIPRLDVVTIEEVMIVGCQQGRSEGDADSFEELLDGDTLTDTVDCNLS